MPSTKTLSIFKIFVLFSAFLSFHQKLIGQQLNSTSKQNFSVSNVEPWNAHAVDSLVRLKEIESNRRNRIERTNRMGQSALRAKAVNKLPGSQMLRPGTKLDLQSMSRDQSICYVISGRDFLRQDSIFLYTGDATFTSDGNILLSGEFADYNISPIEDGGFCIKTDINGNMIWGKLYDSIADVNFDYMNYFKVIELQNGSIMMVGRTTNRVSGNDDLVLTKLDNNGNLIWLKTYESRFWQGFNGSGDYFYVTDLKEDPFTGDIYFVGNHFGGVGTITKVASNDGHVIWSKGYDTYGTEYTFGVVINSANLLYFHLSGGSGNQSNVVVTSINKTTGDTLFNKWITQTGDLYSARLYRGFGVTKLNNGHYGLSGPTTRSWEYPYTGNNDLYHAGIIELDQNLNFVRAYGFKNRVETNLYNTRISLFPDGSGLFTMLDFISGWTAESQVCLFNDGLIYHQRNRILINEGVPYEPPSLQLPDGGVLNIKVLGDSTNNQTRIDYYRIHTSDTASLCLGLSSFANSTWNFDFEPTYNQSAVIHLDVFRESRQKTFSQWNFTTYQQPACTITSNCDTLSMQADVNTVCPGSYVTITIHKNRECGSSVPFVYDTNFVHHVTRVNDTTYSFYFDHPGAGYINGSLMGCTLLKDSVFIEVLPARTSLNIGPDTVICPSNQIIINAGAGFVSYLWQDGSTDSTLTITSPGIYHVTAVNSCGTIYRDTIQVADHPPIPISIGPDRFKCNNDTLRLTAPSGFINYSWYPNYYISSLTTQQVIVNPQTDTFYTVAAEKSPGCFAYDTVHITVRTSPPVQLGADTSICSGDGLILDAGQGFMNYQWSTGAGQQQIMINQPGNYSVIATTADGCSSLDTLRLISLFPLPKPNLGPDSVVCNGQPRSLRSTGTYSSYQWSTGATSSSISVSTAGQYWLTVTDVNGCRGADTTLIPSVVSPPKGFLPLDTSICSYGTLDIKSTGSFNRFLWNTGASTNSINVSQAGTYWLQVTDNNNCIGRDTIIVSPKQCLQGLYVPTGFTPNGDGLNDKLRPLLFGEIESIKFQVFNRWGQLVFETTTPGAGWDGKLKGQMQDPNVFVWICTYQLKGEKTETKKGIFVLIR